MNTSDSPVLVIDGKKVEGYWRRTKNERSHLSWPIPDQTTETERQEILTLLKNAERKAGVQAFRGLSMSRLTNQPVGSREYYLGEWRWPEGLSHYIQRGVPVSKDFLEFLRGLSKTHNSPNDTRAAVGRGISHSRHRR